MRRFPDTTIRRVFLLFALAGLATGCAGALDEIEKGADVIKKEADKLENSNLKDCKDEEGNPLPKWVCQKTDGNDK